MTVGVMGLRYYTFKEPQSNETVILKREPSNPYDSKAVAVYNQQSEKVGYVSKSYDVNGKVFNLLRKQKVSATVVTVLGGMMIVYIELA
ncbi:HIRAN domain-containing protein [Flavisolibacter tropicus]|uniref:HIRAN domain-containing protein n=1 Tax=Flavisolibacter tropicus TaxID=1492898 RepID=A0A172TUI3_9BACT|nr:HIRAN domain-containing protein [Flavisolibacter tropicus]ANE50646.1 hypothetical protein SY85_09160 [Flavisolibacter tropicus]